MKYYTVFAQAYGDSTYGDCTYSTDNPTECVTPGTTTPSTGNDGSLAGTGMDMLLIVSVACLLIFAGLIIRVIRRKSPSLPPKE